MAPWGRIVGIAVEVDREVRTFLSAIALGSGTLTFLETGRRSVGCEPEPVHLVLSRSVFGLYGVLCNAAQAVICEKRAMLRRLQRRG